MTHRYKAGTIFMNDNIETISQLEKDTLIEGKKYSICGFVNAEVKMLPKSMYNAIVFRTPIITYDGMQIIVDIWCESRAQEPRFANNWAILQWVILRGVVFKNKVNFLGIPLYVFKINTSNREYRFIWMSDPKRDFWAAPIEEPENEIENPQFYVLRNDHAAQRGIIKPSKGSVFGKWVTEKERTVYSHQLIGGMLFEQWKWYMVEYRRKITRRFYELMVVEGQLISIDKDRLPLFHR